jgi:hypothetical protein
MGGQPLVLLTELLTAFLGGGGVVREPGVTRGRHSVFYTGELPPWDESLGAFRCLEGCCGPAAQRSNIPLPIDAVECPDCLAAPGESCKRSVSGKPRHKPHAARRKAHARQSVLASRSATALRQASNAAV